jgi:Uma2 family endonuclease
VLLAPFAVTFGTRDTELQPDVLVARYDDLTAKNLPAAPLLAVEVRSPSTALVDVSLKKAAYEHFAVASYWVIDPDVPSFVAYDLVDGGYVEVAQAVGDASVAMTRPFAVTLSPVRLRRGLDPD